MTIHPFDYSKTPTPLPPAPRTIKARPDFGTGKLWSTRLFILPHTLAGIGVLFYLVFILLALLFNTTLPGHITGVHTSQGKKETNYHADYIYTAAGTTYTDSESINKQQYDDFSRQLQPLKPESPFIPVTVHHFNLGPLRTAHLEGFSSIGAEFGFLVLWAAFWNGILSIFLYQLWIVPLRTRLLLKHGLPVTGHITGTRSQSGRNSTAYYIAYDYPDPANLTTLSGEMECANKAAWSEASTSHPVTILVHPHNPKRSVIYEYASYTIRTLSNSISPPLQN